MEILASAPGKVLQRLPLVVEKERTPQVFVFLETAGVSTTVTTQWHSELLTYI